MEQAVLDRLEYHKVKEQLEHYAVSYLGKEHVRSLQPMTHLKAIRQHLDESKEAKELLQQGASVPIPSLEGMEYIMGLLGTGYVFSEQDFGHLVQFLRSCRQLTKYMASKAAIAPGISAYASSMHAMQQLLGEIERNVHGGRVVDSASKELARARKRIATAEDRIKRKLDSLIGQYRNIMQEQLVSRRGDRYVIPIKKEHRRLVKGTVLDESSSGQTVFMEPSEIAALQSELQALKAEEAREETKVLSGLTGLAESYENELRINADTVGIYDYILARGRYAVNVQGHDVRLNDEGRIELQGARHPFLIHRMIPLDFAIGNGYSTLIITGPNTGGKTMALKTVGLLTLMVQSGLLVPVREYSEFAVFHRLAADIGDGQSIEHELSTFSAHIRNMKKVLATADSSTLVLIDEMASGTDPGEGVGLSIAMLEELHRRESVVVVTTHFTEIKNFAAATRGFQNARMEFDTETLEPLYRLCIGEAGQSYALAIASKLGIPEAIIDRSRDIISGIRHQRIVQPTEQPASTEYPPEGRQQNSESQPSVAWGTTGKPADQLSCKPSDHLNFKHTPNQRARQSVHSIKQEKTDEEQTTLQRGDSVYIAYLNQRGIVCEVEDHLGNVGVLVKQQKLKINRKRLQLYIPASKLYPDNYDLDIVFESKENRKKRKLMNRKHVEGIFIETKEEDRS